MNIPKLGNNRFTFIFALVIGLSLRLTLAAYTPGNYDIESYSITASIVDGGENLYASTTRYNYSPIWSFVLWVIWLIPWPFSFTVRAFISLVDLALALSLLRLSDRYAFYIYWLNPVAILLVGAHGQFDNLAALALVCAVYAYQNNKRGVFLFSFLALLIKHIILPGIWLVFIYTSRSRMAALTKLITVAILFIITFLPYLPAGQQGIYENVIFYRSIGGIYGLSALFPSNVVYGIFAGTMVVLPLIVKKELQLTLTNGLLLIFLSFLCFTPGIGEQYFLLPIIFGALIRTPWYWVYTIATSYFLLTSPNNLNLINLTPPWNLIWIVVIFWLMSYFLQLKPVRTHTINPT